jgi:membrane protein YqaA with SNARE-associated domain
LIGLVLEYSILFVWSFLAATIVPIGSEPMLVGVVRSGSSFAFPIAIATFGNFLGAVTMYWMGKRAGKYFEKKCQKSVCGTKAVQLFARFGKPALILSFVPIIGDIIVALAGAAGVSFAAFSGWVITGKAARYATVALIAIRVL